MEEQKYFLKIEFISEGIPHIQLSNIEVPQTNSFDNLDFFHEHVADTIDITSFFMEDGIENDYALVVDDEGLLISNNAVFKLIHKEKYERDLCGTILVGRNQVEDFGIDTVGMTKDEIDDFVINTKFTVIGFTR